MNTKNNQSNDTNGYFYLKNNAIDHRFPTNCFFYQDTRESPIEVARTPMYKDFPDPSVYVSTTRLWDFKQRKIR